MSGQTWESEKNNRFHFGENWQEFLKNLNEERIQKAMDTLKEGLGVENLEGKTLLDAGSGSGLFSLAARRLGAKVHSFDYDPDSVACTRTLRSLYYADDQKWVVDQGSVLDKTYLGSLSKFDVVYSWGVLHHTGSMWEAIDNVSKLVTCGGLIFTAIYNNAGMSSRIWWHLKQLYIKHRWLRPFLIFYGFVTMRSGWIVRGILQGAPLKVWNNYQNKYRGMTAWRDLIDWVGGFPYEYAKPEEIFKFLKKRSFSLEWLATEGGGVGCNQFVFKKI